MFNKLRNRFLLINMLSISAMVIVALIVIYAVSYNGMLSDIHNKMGSVNSFYDVSPTVDEGYSFNQNVQLMPVGMATSFQVQLAHDNSIEYIDSLLDYDMEDYEYLVEQALLRPKDEIIHYEGRVWQYTTNALMVNTTNIVNDFEVEVNTHESKFISFLDVTDSYAGMRQLLLLLAGVGIAMIVLIFFICYIFANRAIRPIETAWQRQKQFVADASHELKTPIAIINANAEAMLANGQNPVLQERKWLDHIREHTGRMGGLVDSMLQLASMEGKLPPDEHSAINLSDTVNRAILSMEALAYERRLQLDYDISPGVVVLGNSEKLQQLALILLDNAVKYTPEGGSIYISLHGQKREAALKVKNSGTDIPPGDMPHLFDRFYRADPSRARGEGEGGGYGLGLSLAKAIAEQMNGAIKAESHGGYTEFAVSIPLINRPT